MNGACLKAEHVQKQNMFLWLFETIIEEEIFYLQVWLFVNLFICLDRILRLLFYFCAFLKMACWYAIFAQETTMHRCGESRVHSETIAGDCDKFTLQGTEWNSFYQTGTKLPFSPLNGNDLNPEMTFSAKHFSSVFAYHYFFFIEWKMSTIKGITKESGLPLHYMGNRIFFNF